MSDQGQDEAESVNQFITRWEKSGAAERSNYALFISELCDLIGVERPDPATPDNAENSYVIDRAVTRSDKDGKKTTVYLDLYKSGHFVLETKQGASAEATHPDQAPLLDVAPATQKTGHGKRGTKAWDKALEKAYHQARAYIRDLPSDEGRPPFLIICDVGHVIELYSEFTRSGGTYLRFPDPKNHRIYLEDLRDPEKRELLRKVWTEPMSLDPSTNAAKVTREVADALARLATSLEKDKHDPQIIALFLQRLLFTLFAEDVGLLPEKSFEDLLLKVKKNPEGFPVLITQLWKDMATGAKFSAVLMQEVFHFNGGLFENPSALPLNSDQITLLIHAARQDWTEVEPAIFGTLLERALDPRERHKLGAHYTPRSYVERLIEPTLMQPLRDQWMAVKAAAAVYHDVGNDKKARGEIEKFHYYLTHINVLDPACGSGNFLYVALARIKELEAEVLDLLEELGGNRMLEMDSTKVRPTQFHGIEINERACAIAQLVLWIGYFQWHHKTTGKADTNDRPLLPKQQTIINKDAVLEYDERIPRKDSETGRIITIWDGTTTKPHPATGKEVPDETARKALFDYINPRRTAWPEADYIVGNPPFLGNKRMRDGLGDGYVEALRAAWKKHKPNSWDFVMYWWHHAAELVRDGKAQRFGFITTNSIHQTFNRRCLEPFLANDKKTVSITFAIPDHPWVDSADGAAVRIAMTVAQKGANEGVLRNVFHEKILDDSEISVETSPTKGLILPNLKIGVNTLLAEPLISNENISSLGFILGGKGFKVSLDLANRINAQAQLAFPIWNGNDLTDGWAGNYVIDAHGLTESQLASASPLAWQHLKNTVYPIRQTNNDLKLRTNWWLFRRANTEYRTITKDLDLYIVTVETAKHRIFKIMSGIDRPEHKLVVIGLSDYASLAILSSFVHVTWALTNGSKLGPTPVYAKTRCFDPFPFPNLLDEELKYRLRDLGERLDAHRKARQAEHPDLTLTGMYNVLEKLRKEEPLNDKDKDIHDKGLVTLLKQIHDDIDQAVYQAYGWTDLWQWQQDAMCGTCYDPETDMVTQLELDANTSIYEVTQEFREKYEQVLLQRLVDLNHERAAEEAQGKIRYLRPDFQNPEGTQTTQTEATLTPTAKKTATKQAQKVKAKWPKTMPEQVTSIHSLISTIGPDPEALDLTFGRANKKRRAQIEQILATLQALGQI